MPDHRTSPRPAGPAAGWRGVVLLGVVAAVYAGLWFFLPGFAHHTQRALARLGLYEIKHDPGVRPPIVVDGRPHLWGGERDYEHFDISDFSLQPAQLHYGLGRERFPALIEPAFIDAVVFDEATAPSMEPPFETSFSVDAAATGARAAERVATAERRRDGERVLVVSIGGETKVYPLRILRRHELVNDVVGGTPIFVAYCYLADLGAAYVRRFGDRTLTFALSGYTYADEGVWDGRDAFVLWDRDTESLWWPPIGRAVSGPLIDTPLTVLDEASWSQTTWGEARVRHPGAQVLAPGQTFAPPYEWPVADPGPIRAAASGDAGVPPRWGENGG